MRNTIVLSSLLLSILIIQISNLSAQSSALQNILEAVNIDSLYESVNKLSGEEPVLVNGGWDTIYTRYTYTYENGVYKARDYIQNKLESYGYEVHLQPFAMHRFQDIGFAPGQTNIGWVLAADKIYGTTDGGQTWTLQFDDSEDDELKSLSIVNDQTVYATGNFGIFVKTDDGGQTWTRLPEPVHEVFEGVFFVNEDTGWVCGNNGTVLKTTDGAANWQVQTTPNDAHLKELFFIDENNGWAVGDEGCILNTNDGGANWTEQVKPKFIFKGLNDVFFYNINDGFAVGWDGRLKKTSNGGSSWSVVDIGTSEGLTGIDFFDQNYGVIVGYNGTCFYTDDGGSSWALKGTVLYEDMYAAEMVSENEIWSSGHKQIAKTKDSGNNWTARTQTISLDWAYNIYVQIEGTTYPEQYYILCAHYDTNSENSWNNAPGADDNGSGDAAVIEAARIFADCQFNHSVKLILFCGEEQGKYGSDFAAKTSAFNGEQILGVLNMDMIAYDGNDDGKFDIHAGTMTASQDIAAAMAANIDDWGLALSPSIYTDDATDRSDHGSYWKQGYPATLQIEQFQEGDDFNPAYDTSDDRINLFNRDYYLEMAKLAIGNLADFAVVDTTVSAINRNQYQAESFILHQNYPNPFNPTTVVKYVIPLSGGARRWLNIVHLDIYNLLGQKVRTLVNKKQTAGVHRVRFDATGLASGVYIYKMQAGNFIQSRKMLLVR